MKRIFRLGVANALLVAFALSAGGANAATVTIRTPTPTVKVPTPTTKLNTIKSTTATTVGVHNVTKTSKPGSSEYVKVGQTYRRITGIYTNGGKSSQDSWDGK
jgi:hypothetical protein